jgi:nitronate monooxygenase
MLHTRLCEILGIEVPIIAAPLGPDLTGPDLVAAVSNAGGLGILQAQLSPPPVLRQELQRLRGMTEKPFGVNFLLHFPNEDNFRVCLEAGVSVFSFFWGDPAPFVAPAHAAGGKVMVQVGSVAAAQQAVQAGVDIVITQGMEAGGHVEGEVSASWMLSRRPL